MFLNTSLINLPNLPGEVSHSYKSVSAMPIPFAVICIWLEVPTSTNLRNLNNFEPIPNCTLNPSSVSKDCLFIKLRISASLTSKKECLFH